MSEITESKIVPGCGVLDETATKDRLEKEESKIVEFSLGRVGVGKRDGRPPAYYWTRGYHWNWKVQWEKIPEYLYEALERFKKESDHANTGK